MARGVPGPGMRRRTTPRQGFCSTALGLLLTFALGGLLPLVLAQPARAATIPINLYASALGWSDHSGGETSPGPTLNFYQGDQVRITLTSDDTPIPLSHGFFIDYTGNGLPDGDDFISETTTSSITFTVPADRAGSFFYRDTVIPLNYGSWSTSPNAAPTASFRAPTAGTSWTGGKAHDISFDITDPDGDVMTYSLSYSYGGGSSQTIRASSPNSPNPNVVSWTPTGFSATDTVLHLDVQDSRGASRHLDSSAFEVDSAAPTITSTTPASDATQVDPNTLIQVDWSEAMNKLTTGAPTAFGVRRFGGAWLAGTLSWSPDAKRMTFDPSSSLSVGVMYEVHVNSTATDDSDPGNAYAGPPSWKFSTGSLTDTTPPSILALGVNPPVAIVNRSVNLTVDVEDLGGLSTVVAHVTGPGYDQNLTMAHASGKRWFVNRVYTATGHYNVTVWATDTSGNTASQAGGMDISPEGTSSLPAPASVTASLADGQVDVSWTPVPPSSDLAGYHVYRRESSAPQFVRLTATPFAATVYRDVSAQPGHTYWYTVTSVDRTGAESVRAQAASVTIPPYQNPPLFDPVPWAVAGVTLGVILGALYGMVWRRRPA